eukprot:TRINITY_DN51129_c0_g1_i1.p2 TRINITY_DN51129_c0_g1~~TRINITY_DN51129_c0_g1_i1.p2  ORF type:complete len:166 (+),score=41.55 TRINITY_DN51129_c0_g1_i1:322-819(+)
MSRLPPPMKKEQDAMQQDGEGELKRLRTGTVQRPSTGSSSAAAAAEVSVDGSRGRTGSDRKRPELQPMRESDVIPQLCQQVGRLMEAKRVTDAMIFISYKVSPTFDGLRKIRSTLQSFNQHTRGNKGHKYGEARWHVFLTLVESIVEEIGRYEATKQKKSETLAE